MAPSRVVFISYSHHDVAWRDRVNDHLKSLMLDGRIEPWSDERIETGADWRSEIKSKLASADAAILLVTRRFLSSAFIRNDEVNALLKRRRKEGLKIYAVIVEPCLWNKFRWLEEMQVVRIADLDKKEPTAYEIDQSLARLVGEIDDAIGAAQANPAASLKGGEDDSGVAAARAPVEIKLTPMERRRRIQDLLKELPEDSIDGLPHGLLALITDASQVELLEEKLNTKAPRIVMMNAVNAIGLLADWSWDHREIKSPQTSLPKLMWLYESLDDIRVRTAIVYALSKFSPPEIPFAFLVDRLAIDPPALKAVILAEMQFYVNRPYLQRNVSDRLLILLHDFCRMPQNQCVYSDEFHSEMDFRFWVFRCLGTIGKAQSATVIEKFIAKHDWPLDALAEAANAHWDITRTPRYVDVLRKAEQAGVAGNTEHALREIEKYLGITPRATKKEAGKARAPRGKKATSAAPPDAEPGEQLAKRKPRPTGSR